MRGSVYCFSPTGAGRRAADQLEQAGLCGEVVDLTLPATRARTRSPRAGGLFTLIFPVYAQRLPNLLRDWLITHPPGRGPACLIGVYGRVGMGNALPHAAKLLEGLGRATVAAAALPAPHSFDCGQTPLDLRRGYGWEGDDLIRFYRQALDKGAGAPPIHLPQRPAIGGLFPQLLLPRLGEAYPAPDPAVCTHCGQCQAHCPTGAALGHPSSCIRCTACIRTCPAGARALRFRTGIPPRYLSSHIRRPCAPAFYL